MLSPEYGPGRIARGSNCRDRLAGDRPESSLRQSRRSFLPWTNSFNEPTVAMDPSTRAIVEAAERGLEEQDRRIAADRALWPVRVVAQYVTGNGKIDETCSLDRAFRLVYARCHFGAGMGGSTFHIEVASAQGAAYDTRLASVPDCGPGQDLFFYPRDVGLAQPSPYTFQAGDQVRFTWTNPGSIEWGLEVGLSLVP
jgi:hypothetical protein